MDSTVRDAAERRPDFSPETMAIVQLEWRRNTRQDINKQQASILFLAKIVSKVESEIEMVIDKTCKDSSPANPSYEKYW